MPSPSPRVYITIFEADEANQKVGWIFGLFPFFEMKDLGLFEMVEGIERNTSSKYCAREACGYENSKQESDILRKLEFKVRWMRISRAYIEAWFLVRNRSIIYRVLHRGWIRCERGNEWSWTIRSHDWFIAYTTVELSSNKITLSTLSRSRDTTLPPPPSPILFQKPSWNKLPHRDRVRLARSNSRKLIFRASQS